MDDFTRWLYQFILERRMNVSNQEYDRLTRTILAQIEQIDSYLSQEQRRELHRLLDTVAEQNCLELEQMFQASLELAKELNGLVRA